MKKILILASALTVSMGAMADGYIGGFAGHKVTPEYNSGFCFTGTLIKDRNGDPLCFNGESAYTQTRLERQLSPEQVKKYESLIYSTSNDCTAFGEHYKWGYTNGCIKIKRN